VARLPLRAKAHAPPDRSHRRRHAAPLRGQQQTRIPERRRAMLLERLRALLPERRRVLHPSVAQAAQQPGERLPEVLHLHVAQSAARRLHRSAVRIQVGEHQAAHRPAAEQLP